MIGIYLHRLKGASTKYWPVGGEYLCTYYTFLFVFNIHLFLFFLVKIYILITLTLNELQNQWKVKTSKG